MDAAAFWQQVSRYNQSTWPVQIVLTLVAVFLTYRVFARPGAKTDLWTKVFLAVALTWNGIVFFLVFLRNPLSMFTGAPLFLIAAVLLVIDVFTQKTHFRAPRAKWKYWLTLLWIALALAYPLIGWPLGHTYPQVLLSMFPCPLTVFAIALIAAAAPQVDKKVFVVLLPWALMGLPKCFGALDCYEDCILFAAGVYGLVELIRNWKGQPGEGSAARPDNAAIAAEGGQARERGQD